VARCVVFLAGPESAMCTGASFDVDGGMLVSNGTPYAAYMAHRTQGETS
jgi:NAD(P)-dependent dehydrogenase (short-subunit alcohol dehydrogenase family)